MTNPTRNDDPIEFHSSEVPPEARALVDAAVRQAREDTFNTVRDALKSTRTDDRWTFIQYCLNGWIESGATGFLIVEYDAGLDDADLRITPGLPKDAKRRAARVVAIDQGDEYYGNTSVKMILESGKVCQDCGAALTQRDGTWVDRSSAYACPSNDAEHKPEQALFEVTHETIELGLQRIRHATDAPDAGPHPEQRNQTSVKFLGRGLRNAIIEADLTHEAAQLDVWSYTAIVEIALFGEIRYA